MIMRIEKQSPRLFEIDSLALLELFQGNPECGERLVPANKIERHFKRAIVLDRSRRPLIDRQDIGSPDRVDTLRT